MCEGEFGGGGLVGCFFVFDFGVRGEKRREGRGTGRKRGVYLGRRWLGVLVALGLGLEFCGLHFCVFGVVVICVNGKWFLRCVLCFEWTCWTIRVQSNN